MKNKQLSIIFFLLSIITMAQNTKTIGGFNHLESIATDGKFLYAADIGKTLSPSAKDSDGQIVKLDRKGKILANNFAQTTLNAPKGLAINKKTLFAADIDRIVAIDTESGKLLYAIDLSKDSAFLNDIAVWDDNTLFVSGTDKNRLFKINLTDKSYTEIKTDKTIAGINGLFCHKKSSRLYVNGFGADNQPNGVIGYINLKDNTFIRLTGMEGHFDGIFISKDVLFVSNWVAFEKKGVVMAISLFNQRAAKVKMPEPIAGPADFIIINDQLIIPAMMSGEIHFVELDSTLSLKL